tara:strand:- start:56 stop:721 length:666 start_codon:yes stop_codon:yes gene_type:complete
MNILSIDTSTDKVSVALKINNKVDVLENNQKIRASQIILSVIDEILKKNKIKSEDLKAITFNKGPASFTGTRIAASIAQAIGYSNNIPVFGISSLSLMAYSTNVEYKCKKILCVKKAFGNLVYWAIFDIDKYKFSPISGNHLTNFNEIQIDTKDKYCVVSDCMDELFESKKLNDPNIIKINYTEHEPAKKLINYVVQEDDLEKSFNYEDTLPDYAGHSIND